MSEWKVIATDSATVGNSAVALNATNFTGFTAAQLAAARAIQITPTQDIRFRQDGTSPTSTVGHYVSADENLVIQGRSNFVDLEMIRALAANATVTVTLYGAEVTLTPSRAPTA